PAGTDARERDAVAVVGIHVGLDLEDEGAHLRLGRLDAALVRVLCARRRRELAEAGEQVADAEILQRRAEIDRREMALADGREIERTAGMAHELELLGERGGIEVRIALAERREVDRRERRLAVLADEPHLPGRDVERPGEITAAPERPGDRRGVERERLLDLVEKLERVAALAVPLVDEGEHADG